MCAMHLDPDFFLQMVLDRFKIKDSFSNDIHISRVMKFFDRVLKATINAVSPSLFENVFHILFGPENFLLQPVGR